MAAPDPARRAAARAALARAGVAVLLEDNHLLGVAKPAGLLAQGGPAGATSLVEVLDRYRREAEGKPGAAFVGLVHRLDRNVSGALVVAKTSKAASRLAALFRERDPRLVKTYLAWVAGAPQRDAGELADRLARQGGVSRVLGPDEDEEAAREVRLAYTVQARATGSARLSVRLHSGATHQIRAQCAAQGWPLHGDAKYGGPPGARVALHARCLAFPHPVGDAPVVLEAPVPDDLRALDRRLGLRPPVA